MPGDNPNTTPRPLRPPNRRHILARVRQDSFTKARNSVIASWVDVVADIAAINSGQAIRRGDTFVVNGRTYGVEPNDAAYPISGPGVFELGRGAYHALGVYNAFGQSTRAEEILDAMNISAEERAAARRAWSADRGV